VLFGLGFVEIISLPLKDVLRGVFLANQLASHYTDNLTRTTKRQNTYKRKLMLTHKVVLINKKIHTQKPMLKENTDRAWFSCLL